MERPPSEAAARAFEELEDSAVRFPAGVFQLGARLEDLPRALRALDVRERLALGALLKPTPPRWVFLTEFALASRPVTNGEYLRFLEDVGYEDPLRWQRVFEDHAIDQVEHYALPESTPFELLRGRASDEERLRKTWESYAGARSFLVAFVRSVVHEIERDLDLSPRFAEKESVWDETRPIDRPRAGELAQVAALAVRALAPYLPADFRRELAPDERGHLQALEAEPVPPRAVASASPSAPAGAGVTITPPERKPDHGARRAALEALDSILGKLRDRHLESLKASSSRVTPELERGLLERDYGASDFPVGSLKFLDRLRTACARQDGGTIPLRRLVYPLSWGPEEPRLAQRDRPDRMPWSERPVTGISLYEALAYADWLGKAAGERALVRLPSEAQLERAASWPSAPRREKDGAARETVDPRWKQVFPWETRSSDDPSSFAPPDPSSSGETVRSFSSVFAALDRSPFDLDIRELRELIRKSARQVGERRIEMLLGFHWEWTRDRLSELEPGYEQLDRAEPLGREHEAVLAGTGEPVAATYYCGSSRRGPWFAARGGPRRLGGPGLTTRRFGLYPLRGTHETGFRLVVEPKRREARRSPEVVP